MSGSTQTLPLSVALVAGALVALNPCSLPLLPPFLSYYLRCLSGAPPIARSSLNLSPGSVPNIPGALESWLEQMSQTASSTSIKRGVPESDSWAGCRLVTRGHSGLSDAN